MKKYFGFLTILALSLTMFTSCDKEEDYDEMEEMEELSNNDPALRAMKMMGDTLDYPTAIDDYLASNYPDLTIDEVELDEDGNFVVTLSDDKELLFDAAGVFIEILTDNEEDDDAEEEEDGDEVTEWPAAIDDYVVNNYPDAVIDEVELNTDGTYEIELDDDTELLFDADGNFLEVIVEEEEEDDDDDEEEEEEVTEWPAAIDEYVATNHPGTTIEEVELEDGIYEVELDDDTELEFDAEGNFIG